MSEKRPAPRSVEEQLLDRPRRIAGIDGLGRPVRLGEFDSQGYLVGYIDEDGLAWESLRERIVAVCGNRLADAMALPYEHPGRDGASLRPPPRKPLRSSPPDHHSWTAVAKFHDERDILRRQTRAAMAVVANGYEAEVMGFKRTLMEVHSRAQHVVKDESGSYARE